ncbi:MAG TPA: pentapeptide repeat-containing protein, partial [Candidatus Acidoferrales bacterium]|nr:pentapeptide repeat-containing protein [Candidatus Acidoferrales bacterium]
RPVAPEASSSDGDKNTTAIATVAVEPSATDAAIERERAEKPPLRPGPDGLIPASQLPSAADIFADLFSDDRSTTRPREAYAFYAPTLPTPAAIEPPRAAVASPELELKPEVLREPQLEPLTQSISSPVDVSPALETGDIPSDQAAVVEPELPAGLDHSIASEALLSGPESLPEADPPPEIALSVERAERDVDEAATQELPVSSPVTSALSQTAVPRSQAPSVPSLPASDWAFEEKLAAHKEWLDSKGASGRKADFAEAQIPSIDLINVNLRHADLQGANLKGADLLLADLRDSCLVRTNLEDACLVGANLEGANLEGATLDGAMGLLPQQLAGANLHDASVPDPIARFEARTAFAKASKTAMQFFIAMMAISAASVLIVWRTKDLQLLTDSSIFPFLHARSAAALPTAQVYLIAPVALFIVYLVLQFHLQTLWDAVLELPAVFPDGAEIGHNSPRIIRALLRAHFRWMNKDAPSTRIIERALGLVLAYWLAPAILLLFWARFLTLQDLHGTALHAILVAVAVGVALYSSAKIGRPQERWVTDSKRTWHWTSKLRNVNPMKSGVCVGLLLLFFSAGTIKGVPHSRSRAPQFSDANVRRWAPDVFWSFGYDPYANLTEAAISIPPANWDGADSSVSRVKGANLNDMSLRYAQAYGVFLAHAHLWHTDWEGAFLSDADFRGADLGQAAMRYAVMDRARLYNANLDRADLKGANLDRADFRKANLSYSSLDNAILIDAQFQDSSLYGARLTGASMQRANFERADLRSSFIGGANLEHADLRNAYLWSAKLPGADLENAQLGSTILIDSDLRNVDLRGAQFAGTVMTGANLSGAIIDGTDLRGALLLTASQICSTKSRAGALLTDSLASAVRDACGGPLLVAPAQVVAPPAQSNATQSPTRAAHKNSK